MAVRCIRKEEAFSLKRTEGVFEPELTRFVAGIYYNHKNYQFQESFNTLWEQMLEEDRLLAPYSRNFTIYSPEQQITATIRLIAKTPNTLLPVEREFGFQVGELRTLTKGTGMVYELARFASATNQSRAVMMLLRELIGDTELDDLLLAGLDADVLQKTKRIGLSWVEIGPGKHYLGSVTHPVALSMRSHVEGIFTPYVEAKKALQREGA